MKKMALSMGAILLVSGLATSVSAYAVDVGGDRNSGLNQLDAGRGRFQLPAISRNAESFDFGTVTVALAAKSETISSLLDKWKSSESENDGRGGTEVDDSIKYVLGEPSFGERAREIFGKDREDVSSLYEHERNNARKQHVAPVPEPEVYAMMLGGVGFVGAMARRRQRKSA